MAYTYIPIIAVQIHSAKSYKGYTESRPLSATDRAVIPVFVALREIWHTALIAWLQPSSGVQGFDHILQRTIRLLREWEAEL